MSFKLVAVKSAVLLIVGVITVSEPTIRTQSAQRVAPPVRLPDEAAGINGIVRALISAYDQFDIVALGEYHGRPIDSDLRIALVRHPEFAKKVRTIVVEWGSTLEQTTLDRYIRGENVSKAQFEQVWKKLSPGNIGDLVSENSIYTDFFAAVREVNSKLPAAARIRVFGGDPGPAGNRGTAAVAILEEQALKKGRKALIVYGAGHFYRDWPKDQPPGNGRTIVRMLEMDYPGRTLAVIRTGGPGDDTRDYQKFDRALKTQVRPVMVPLQRLPFRDFTAEEALGGQVLKCRPVVGCVSIFKDSGLSLGQMGNALIYYGKP
jgi:hypothetical protein